MSKSNKSGNQSVDVSRWKDSKGRFVKGNNANPRGRIPVADGGSPNKATELRHYIGARAHDIIDAMIENAIAGDTAAQDKLLTFIVPKLSATALTVDDRNKLPIMNIINVIGGNAPIDAKVINEESADSVQNKKNE